MRKPVFICIPLLITALFLGSIKPPAKPSAEPAPPGEDDILVLYGKAIYQRESCDRCHTQQIIKSSPQLISLDGLGGKYQDNWLYDYLADPLLLKPGSAKPPYTALYSTPLNKDLLLKIIRDQGLADSPDSLWNTLTTQSEAQSAKLNQFMTATPSTSNTEIIALIAYLQQIPASTYKITYDSLLRAKYMHEQKKWDEIVLDSSSILLTIANNDANIKVGKKLFEITCAVCHGQQGQGGIGPNLTDEYWLHGGSKLDIAKTIIYGIPAKGMISWKSQLRPEQVGALVAYIASIQGSDPPNPKAPQGTKQ